MGHESEENWTKIDKLAYDLYSEHMRKLGAHEQAAEWWFKEYKDQKQFKKFYAIAERKEKIKKILK